MEKSDGIIKGEVALQRCLRAVAEAPRAAALFCDIDGTVAPIAGTPHEAAVPAGTQAMLTELAAKLGLLAFVTGRDLEDGRRMVGVEGAAYVGAHGLDLLTPAGDRVHEPAAEHWVPLIAEMLDRARLAGLPGMGVILEDKRIVAALHYRPASDRQAARRAIVEHVIGPATAAGLHVSTGHMAFELRPPLEVTKGTAVHRLLEAGSYGAGLFLGDDLTDCSGFDVLHRWAAERPTSRLGLAVAALTSETPALVKEASDVWVKGTHGMLEVLARIVLAAGPQRGGPQPG